MVYNGTTSNIRTSLKLHDFVFTLGVRCDTVSHIFQSISYSWVEFDGNFEFFIYNKIMF